MNAYLLALDQGTTSTRAILFDAQGRIHDIAQKELEVFYPENGWVEQDAARIWADSREVLDQVIARAPGRIAGLGITNQRETTVLWNRRTGEPVCRAIVWQDRRTAEHCRLLQEGGHEPRVREKTGLLLDPYFSGTKIRWAFENVPGLDDLAEKGDLAFGTIDSWLIWKLTGGKVHATDATNASRTLLMNLHTRQWDPELLDLLRVPSGIMPEIRDCASDFGTAEIAGTSLPIAGVAGDQQAALIGQACFSPGMVKSTYGTGCFALMNTGEKACLSEHRLLSTPAYVLNGECSYALEGAIFAAGAAIQWLRDGLGIIATASESETLAASLQDNGGVYMVPAFTGLGAPHWNPYARAVIAGLTRGSGKAHLARAALEAQAYQTCDLLRAMQADTGQDIREIRVDGGLVANQFMTRFMADILNVPVLIPEVTETTALGAAYLAGLQQGVYADLQDIADKWVLNRCFEPSMSPEHRMDNLEGWEGAIRKTLS